MVKVKVLIHKVYNNIERGEMKESIYSSENTYDINGIETPPYLFVCMFHYLISLKKIEIAERYLPYLILCTCHKRDMLFTMCFV